jgi:cytochrome c biogenesis protein CcmG/thiol:disulfide interchange protein DsbE
MKRLPPLVIGAVALVVGLLALFALGLAVAGQQGRRPEAGTAAPTFTLVLYDEHRAGLPKTVSLADLRGKPVVLNFWASWCIPCRDEAPEFEAASRRYKEQVVFVGVNWLEVEAAALPYLKQQAITYANGFDTQQQVARAYRITGVPETFFIDRNGILRRIETRPLTAADLDSAIQELLK